MYIHATKPAPERGFTRARASNDIWHRHEYDATISNYDWTHELSCNAIIQYNYLSNQLVYFYSSSHVIACFLDVYINIVGDDNNKIKW